MATLINGNGNLAIYAQQDADWYAALMGGQTVITAVGNQFAYELLASNTIGVKDGVIITSEGRRIQLDANAIDSFDIPTGAQGTTNYYIIGYHLVTGNQSEQTCETFVQLMENGTDTIPEGSFRDGDDEVFVSLYRVEQDDLTIGTITLLLPQLSGSFQSQISQLNNDLTKKALVNTYYDSSDNNLYQVNADGTKGGKINIPHNYTSVEKIVGTLNGKNVYEKTYYNTTEIAPATTVIDSSINSNNIKALVSIDGSVYTPVDGYIVPINLIGSAKTIYCDITASGLTLHSNVSVSKKCITYRYIKN